MSEKNPIAAARPQDDPANGNAAAGVPSEIGSKSLLSEHKGKLAIGVAATLGIMIFYNWREKRLAKKDPEGYARLQRLKALVRTDETDAKHKENKKASHHVSESSEQVTESGYEIHKQ
jgi:hypothetical protein